MRTPLSNDGTWFHRGKEARANGQPRELQDARISVSNRAAFFAGWDEQDGRMNPRTPAQTAEFNRRLGELKAAVARDLHLTP